MRIVWLDRATFGPRLRSTRPSFVHEWSVHDETPVDQVAVRLRGAEIAITNKVPIGRDMLAELPKLKMIAVSATGYDCIDIEACTEAGIVVSNVRGYAENTVPEHVFSLVLALRRSLVAYRQDVIAGEWQRANQFCFHSHPINDLAGSHLGIMGEGVLGQAVARLGRAFGMNVLFAAHKGVSGMGPLYTPFDDVLARSDVISIHTPLTAATRDMLSMPEFEKMSRRPLIINCARGGIVQEDHLVAALERGLVSGIGIDVLTSEPPSADNPLMRVMERHDVIVTPHVAWASQEAMQTCWDQVIEHIDNFQSGKPTNVVS